MNTATVAISFLDLLTTDDRSDNIQKMTDSCGYWQLDIYVSC